MTTDSRLLILLDVLPGPVPTGAPIRGTTCNLRNPLALDLSPPPLDADGWPTRIDGLDVAARMLAQAMGLDTTGGVIWESVGEGRYFLRPSTGFGVYFGPRGGGDRFYEVPTLFSIDRVDPLAARLALAAVIRSGFWRPTPNPVEVP